MIKQIKDLIDTQKVHTVLHDTAPKGEAVMALQTALFHIGYGTELDWGGNADGFYRKNTRAAIKAFAERAELPSDGKSVSVDIANRLMQLDEAVPALRVLKSAVEQDQLKNLHEKTSHHHLVKALQQLLAVLGFGAQLNPQNKAHGGVDGFYQNDTLSALRAFSQKHDVPLSDDGKIVDEGLAFDLMDLFTPQLGDEWERSAIQVDTPSSSRRVSGSGQYRHLFPLNKARDDKGIRNKRGRFAAENIGTNANPIWVDYRYEFEPGKYKIEGENLRVPFVDVKKFKKNPSAGKPDMRVASYFFPKDDPGNKPKERIVLHFTLGHTEADLKTLTKEKKPISTAYVLGRDGTIYRLFSPEQFAWHLGDQYGHNARSIGIEITNFGTLKDMGNGVLNTANGNAYCTLDDTDAYYELVKPYRGSRYYAKYTPEQYEGLIILLRYLTKEFDIPKHFRDADPADVQAGNWKAIPRHIEFKNRAEADAFKGICSHVNYRPARDKQDIGPAFDWEQVIEGVMAETYQPQLIKTRRMGGRRIRSEAEMLQEAANLQHGDIKSDAFGPNGPDVDI